MLTLKYFRFFNDSEVDQLDDCVLKNYQTTLDYEHFFVGNSYVPDVKDILLDRRKGIFRNNITELVYRSVISQLHQHHPEWVPIAANPELQAVYQHEVQFACERRFEHMEHDVTTLLYMRSMSFREGTVMCNSSLTEVW